MGSSGPRDGTDGENGQTGLCRFGSPPCLAFPSEATNYVVLGNHCDP